MSAERLREAAEALDLGLLFGSIYSRDRDEKTAALLRSVADGHRHIRLHDESDGICAQCKMIWPCSQANAALALADAVLGGNE